MTGDEKQCTARRSLIMRRFNQLCGVIHLDHPVIFLIRRRTNTIMQLPSMPLKWFLHDLVPDEDLVISILITRPCLNSRMMDLLP